MLKRLYVRNFTVFAEADFAFSPGLNVIVGANGTGKSHVLKLGYAVGVYLGKLAKPRTGQHSAEVEAFAVQAGLMNSLQAVFQTTGLWALRRTGATTGPQVRAVYDEVAGEVDFDLSRSTASTSGVVVLTPPNLAEAPPAPLFIPAKEVLSFFAGFSTLYRKYNLAFDQTYLDLCEALSVPLLREPAPALQPVMRSLEGLMGGQVRLEDGRFYLYPIRGGERQEINLAAEGIRKIATLAQLIANGSLTAQTTLFWDEPEANLNPALIKELAALLLQLAKLGFQIILATHSLFLLKEFHILTQQQPGSIRYFGLSADASDATQVATADELPLLPDIVALDAELVQSDAFLSVLNADDAHV